MANEFVAKNGLISQNNTVVSGSLTVTGGITGSFQGTGSYTNQALSSSYSQTASYAPAYLPLTGGTIDGNVTLNGTASIAYLNVQYESASVIYSSGSNQFGDAANDTQTLYGTVVIPVGSLTVTGSIRTTDGITGSFTGSVAGYVPNTATSSFIQNSQTSSMTVATASYVTASNVAGTVLSASFATTASYVANAIAFPYTGVATITGSLIVVGTGSTSFTSQYTSSATSQSFFLVGGTIRNSGSLSSSVYGVNIAPTLQYITSSQTATALRVQPTFISGSTAVSNSVLNIIADLGTTGVGTQFQINDITSGSIYQINNVSGLPLVDVTSDSIFSIYNYPTRIFQASGSSVTITGSLKVSGTLDATVTYAQTASVLLGLVDSASYSRTAVSASITVDTTANTTHYLTFVSGTSGYQGLKVDSTGLRYNPFTEILTVVGGVASTASWATNALTASFLAGGTPGTPGGPNLTYQFGTAGLFSGSNVLRFVDDTAGIVATGSFSGSFRGALTGTASYASQALSASFATSASLAQTASYISPTFISASAAASGFGSGGGGGGGTGNGFPYTGSAILSGSLNMIATGSTALTITGSVIQSQSLGAQIYGINITPTMVYTTASQTNTAFRVAPLFSGSSAFTASQTNIVADFGATNVGTQFSVTDVTSGSIYTVNDISGLPIIEALSDWTVNMYNFPTTIFQKTGSAVNINGTLTVSGSTVITGSLRIQSGSNTPVGSAVLVAGRALVSNTIVTANSTIFLTPQSGSGTQGFLSVGAKVAATSFAVSSSSTTDTSTFGYLIIN